VPQQPQPTSVNNHHQTHHSHALNLTRNNGTSGSGNGGTPSSVAAVASGGGTANFPQTSRRLRTNSNNAAINASVDNSLVSGIN
jgi:hypothetical protein